MIVRLIIKVRLVIIVVNKQYKLEDISESNRRAGNKLVVVVVVIVVVKGQKLN